MEEIMIVRMMKVCRQSIFKGLLDDIAVNWITEKKTHVRLKTCELHITMTDKKAAR